MKAAEDICLNETPIFPEPIQYKQFYNCFFEELGFLKNGTIQTDVMLQKSSTFKYPNFVKNCVRKCKDIKGTDRYDVAVKLGLCINKVNIKYFNDEWIIISNECRKEQKLEVKDISKLKENPSESVKNYSLCVFERQGLLKDNVLQENVILEIVKDYKDAKYLKVFLDKCKDIDNDDRYVKAFKLYECLKNIKGKEFEKLL